MPEPKAYESYPLRSVLAYNIILLVNYIVGIYILTRIDLVWGSLFLAYVIILELKVYKEGCVNCYYYGKRCFSGRGAVVSKFLKRGNPKKFCERKVTIKDLIPTIMALVFPTIGAGYLLWQNLDPVIIGLIIIPWLIWFIGNPLIYGKLACLHCKQGRICCPANDFFGKKNKD